MSERLPALSARQMVAVLDQLGFRRVRQSSYHVVFRYPDGRRTTVPIHSNRTLGRGLVWQIMRATRI